MSDGLGRAPERKDFEAWAVCAGFAYRNHLGFWFHRNGGDGLWEAYWNGACAQRGRDAVASRDHMNAVLTDIAIIKAPARTRIKILNAEEKPGEASPTADPGANPVPRVPPRLFPETDI